MQDINIWRILKKKVHEKELEEVIHYDIYMFIFHLLSEDYLLLSRNVRYFYTQCIYIDSLYKNIQSPCISIIMVIHFYNNKLRNHCVLQYLKMFFLPAIR